MTLRETQRLMWRAMTWPTGVADFLRQADPATRRAFAQTFAETPGFSRQDRVSVYAESYYWRLEDVLREQFRVTAWIAGDVAFHNLCTDYVLARPSRRADVRRFAAPFREFVTAHPLARAHVGLDDVARIEWGAVEAIDAADVRLWREDDLAAVALCDWPPLVLRAAPSVSLHRCRLPYAKAWAARDAGEPSPTDPLPACTPPQWVLVWRGGLEVFHRTVADREAEAISALVAGTDFGTLVQHADARGVQAPEVVAWLRRWLRDGLVAAP